MKIISSIDNDIILSNIEKRKPKGFGISPYPLLSTIRYLVNNLTNGYFSYINPDHSKMRLLNKEGRIKKELPRGSYPSTLKILFLGDIMVLSGKPPQISCDLKKILKSADIIVANVESPVVKSKKPIKRGFSLNFEMDSSFLSSIYSSNPAAKWIFSIANNHACDNSRKSPEDVSGVEATVDNIRAAIPGAEVIGAEIGLAKSVLSLKINETSIIGFVGWTELMNHDKEHYKKKIIRGTDLTERIITDIKNKYEMLMLIGYAHGNEEHSNLPLKETRDRWYNLVGPRKFDIIIGHGPHVLHPAEKVGESGLLFHSIGNFCSPYAKSQFGCIPEIVIHYENNKISTTDYKVHILQQQKDSISIIKDLNVKSQIYPNMISRLKDIWGTLFT